MTQGHTRKSGGRTIESKTLIDEFREKELGRRALIRGALAASAAAAAAPVVAACGGGRSGGGGGDPDAGPPAVDSGPPDGGPPPAHLTGMGYSDVGWLEAVDAALAQTIGLSMIRPGDTVYFKVNCNNGDLYPHSTRPDLIRTLGQRARDLGATRLIVGDRSFWGDPGTASNMRNNGVSGAAMDIGAELMIFDDLAVDWVMIPQDMAPNWNGGFRLPLPVVEATHIINLPCIKTHFISHFTMALKNCLGLVNPLDRRRTGNLDTHAYPRLWSQIAQVNQAFTPSLNIMDGYEALTTGGPTRTDGAGPTYEEPRVAIVSTDRIATDVVGIAVLQTLSPPSEEVTQYRAWASPQIQQAVALGNGITSPDMLDLSGPTVPRLEEYRGLATAT